MEWDHTPLVSTEGNNNADYELPVYATQGGDWVNSAFFWINIIWYFTYCVLVQSVAWPKESFEEGAQLCIEGSWYELQMATQLNGYSNATVVVDVSNQSPS